MKMNVLANNTTQSISPESTHPLSLELKQAESELMQAVKKLHAHKCIHGTWPTLEELLNPVKEKEVGNSPYHYPGGDEEIIAKVKNKASPDVNVDSNNDSGDEGDDKSPPEFTYQQGEDLCTQMEQLCLQCVNIDSVDLNNLQWHV
ncbi:hypothetical protein J3R82DRAFT_2226 [Butyriboletus roseoflavus]|nr:hypothetical protein J3R82DRAFT_2226 [Butyriboletus roseoflavus]